MDPTTRATTNEAATQTAEDKIEQTKAKSTTNQVKLLHRILRVSLKAYQVGFINCNSTVERLFLAIDVDFLKVSSSKDSKFPTFNDVVSLVEGATGLTKHTVNPIDEGSSSQARDNSKIGAPLKA